MPFTSALLEIDAKTKVIRQMELIRQVDGQQKISFTFTLIDQENVPKGTYSLDQNLGPNAEIFGPDRPAERGELLDKLLTRAQVR